MIENALREFMINQGVDAMDAEFAARRCSKAITKGAITGAVLFLLVGLETANPSTLLMAGIGGVGGGALALGKSDACQDVRDAASELARLEKMGSPF